MSSVDFIARYIPNFFLIMIRAGFILVMLPFFGSRTIPATLQIGLVSRLSDACACNRFQD